MTIHDPDTRPTVLIFDEAPELRRLFDVVLRRVARCVVPLDVSDALAMVQGADCDAVIVELATPGSWEVLTAATEAHVPVVVVTSWIVPDQLAKAESMGAVAVVTKPYDVAALRDTVLLALAKR